ncbi:hypothetical protein [Polynucleobacter antarcticus]|nr:hypothetical protein [Polynucleobacter antarcticus]
MAKRGVNTDVHGIAGSEANSPSISRLEPERRSLNHAVIHADII